MSDIQLQARHMPFEFKNIDAGAWSNGDRLKSHFVNGVIFILPAGEDFFIKTMRRVKPMVKDEKLKKKLGKFCGQEAHHAKSHRVYNDYLVDQGYEKLLVHEKRLVTVLNWLVEKGKKSDFIAKFNIALTAAAEHFTSTIAHLVVSDPEQLLQSKEPVSSMLYWHAVEEIEHKDVCFDIFQEVSGSYIMRIVAYFTIMLLFGGFWVRASGYLYYKDKMHKDGKLYNKLKTLIFTRYSDGRIGLLRKIFPEWLLFFKPNFHPNQIDDYPLIEQWVEDYKAGKDLMSVEIERYLPAR